MPLTLEIPDELAKQLESIPEEERHEYVVVALINGNENASRESTL
jgi:hypothetical protein